ncbi:hypothetical protein [Agaribacterium haliotis]|uniref:hypothetical protein n=1 Tax=Agaribacterium haliotis TaxID=2013869 RepID=UPI00117765DC|nr:hypothetical protein [Agaribacterium haliotis]
MPSPSPSPQPSPEPSPLPSLEPSPTPEPEPSEPVDDVIDYDPVNDPQEDELDISAELSHRLAQAEELHLERCQALENKKDVPNCNKNQALRRHLGLLWIEGMDEQAEQAPETEN